MLHAKRNKKRKKKTYLFFTTMYEAHDNAIVVTIKYLAFIMFSAMECRWVDNVVKNNIRDNLEE